MKVRLTCPICLDEAIARMNAGGGNFQATPIYVPLQDSNVYTITCDKGHESTVSIQNNKFELLFESGILALKDGYFREAVTSFAASLERFYEVVATALLINEIKANNQGYTKLWNSVSSQSERQIGGVFFLYFKEFGEPITAFDKIFLKENGLDLEGRDPVNFRNIVVHQGFIPKYDSALHYGEAVNKYIRKVLKSVAARLGPQILDALHYNTGVEEHGGRNMYFMETGSIIIPIIYPELGVLPVNESLIEHME